MQRNNEIYKIAKDHKDNFSRVMSVEKWDKRPRKQCHCGTVISKYNTRNWCRACQRKGKDNEPKE